MNSKQPEETFPSIGTVENPALFCDGYDLLLCYEVAPIDDGGNVILSFSGAVYFEQNPCNVHPEGIGRANYPARAWDFTEVLDSDRTARWRARRFWTISFNDVMVEVVFSEVRQIHRAHEAVSPQVALLNFLGAQYRPADR